MEEKERERERENTFPFNYYDRGGKSTSCFFWFFWRKSNKIAGFSLFYFSPSPKLDAQTQNLKKTKIFQNISKFTSVINLEFEKKLIINLQTKYIVVIF